MKTVVAWRSPEYSYRSATSPLKNTPAVAPKRNIIAVLRAGDTVNHANAVATPAVVIRPIYVAFAGPPVTRKVRPKRKAETMKPAEAAANAGPIQSSEPLNSKL